MRRPTTAAAAVTAAAAAAVTAATVAAAALAACSNPTPPPPPPPRPGSPEALAAYLQPIIGADLPTRRRAVASWRMARALWDRTVIETYRPLHDDYLRAFDAESPIRVDRLAHPGTVAARRHFAGDPRLTLPEARDRWAVPTLFPSLVADAGGAPIDAVFVPDGANWGALIGLDTVVQARVTALDPACAARLALAGPAGPCTDVGAAIADAALRTDGDQLAHVCRLAETLCGKRSP